MSQNTSEFSNLPAGHHSHSRSWTGLLLAFLVIALFACGGNSTTTTAQSNGGVTTTQAAGGVTTTQAAGGGSTDTGAVSIDNFAFSPSSLTVKTGTTVTWTNDQATNHTVTGDAGEFDSGQLAQGASSSQTFDTAGTFAYHCEIHPNMTGTVTVEG